MTFMQDEILEEEEIVRKNSGRLFEKALECRELLGNRNVIVTGSGTSYHASLFLSNLMIRNERVSIALPSSELSSIRINSGILKNSVSFIFSHSGESSDAIKVEQFLRSNGSVTIALTDFSDLTLAHSSNVVVDLGAGIEKSIAATKSHITQLLFASALYLGDDEGEYKKLVSSFLAVFPKLRKDLMMIEHFSSLLTEKNVILGSGLSVVLAMEFSLKLKETSEIISEWYPVREFLHGPIQLLDSSWNALFLANDEIAMKKIKKTGAAIYDIAGSFSLDSDLDELQNYLKAIPYIQMISNFKALSLGKNPDKPSKLNKVVRN